MAANFNSVFSQPDFLPSIEEMNNYKKKIEESFSPRKRQSIESVEYDDYGRNLTEQKKRQNKIKWEKVRYKKMQVNYNSV